MLSAGARVGDYEIEAVLGTGGMATVYRARHVFLGSQWALKVLDPRFRTDAGVRRRFLDEARIQHTHLDHPNVVKVVNIVSTEEHAALVMELVLGGNLEDELPRLRGRPDEVLRLMLAILDGVEHAHAAGIIHRDLKPANVLLARQGEWVIPKVTDFGIAKLATELALPGKKSTHGDSRMGTLSYMSPEQIKRAKDVTPRSDVFSLGAMLYEMATGVVAFGGDSDYEVMDGIVNGRYRPPAELDPRIDPRLAWVIATALQADPARRFASCRDMADALRGGAARPSAPMPAQPPPRVSAPMPAQHVSASMPAQHPQAHAAYAPPPSPLPQAVAQPWQIPTPAGAVPINGGRAFALLLFAALLLVGVFTSKWLQPSEGDEDVGIGLRGLHVCAESGECRSLSWSELEDLNEDEDDIPDDIPAFGWIALLAGVVTAGGALISAFSREGARVVRGGVGLAAALALCAMVYFLIRLMTKSGMQGSEPGYSGIIACIGCLGVAIASRIKP